MMQMRSSTSLCYLLSSVGMYGSSMLALFESLLLEVLSTFSDLFVSIHCAVAVVDVYDYD